MDVPRSAPPRRRIALIHALRNSVDPILDSFARLWPEAETFNLLDDFNREAIHIEVDTSITSTQLVRILERIARSVRCRSSCV